MFSKIIVLSFVCRLFLYVFVCRVSVIWRCGTRYDDDDDDDDNDDEYLLWDLFC